MQLSIKTNYPAVLSQVLADRKQGTYALMQAINDTTGDVQAAIVTAEQSNFDRPTPFIIRAVRRTFATRANLVGTVLLQYPGGKATDPNSVLQAEIDGGSRNMKRAEVALRTAGILPNGYYLVPGAGAPLDAYGNVPGSFMVRIITFFQASSEQGYRANMTDRSKRRLAKFGKTASGLRTINGVQYFVAYGTLRDGRGMHLKPGIYARRGIQGVDVTPILMFVRKPVYQKRLDFDGIGKSTIDARFPGYFAARYAAAVRTAR